MEPARVENDFAVSGWLESWCWCSRGPHHELGESVPPVAGRVGLQEPQRLVLDLRRENTIGKLNRWVILKSNFEISGLVFSCIETKFCKKILVG